MKIVIFGSGGMSRETAFLIEEINKHLKAKYQILGYIEKEKEKKNTIISGYPILGDYKALEDMEIDGFALGIGNPKIKKKVYENEIMKIKKKLNAPNLIHPDLIFRKDYIDFGIGNIICAGNIFTTDIQIGNFNIINRKCTIGHDVKIGHFNLINPRVTISGGVEIGNNVLIGASATLLQNRRIGDDVVIGAGAVVTKDVEPGATVVGVPAKRI
ncbi:MAG: acetyltransferase [Candidatus Odinarchaeota archaeon]